jgi:hypothetical protein
LISVRSEVQILPGPPPAFAKQNAEAASAVAQLPRERLGAEGGSSQGLGVAPREASPHGAAPAVARATADAATDDRFAIA